MDGDVHVVFQNDRWHVKIEGRDGTPESTHATQQAAIDAGRDAARAAQRELLIHGEDGAIRERDSYGHDPRHRPG